MLRNIIFSISLIILATGCSKELQNISNLSYDTGNVNNIREIQYGVIKKAKVITIKDDGKGTILGGLVGGFIGSRIGKSEKQNAVIGAVAGSIITNKAIETKGQELTIELDNKKTILIGVTGNSAINYLRVKLLIENNKLIALEPSKEPLKTSLINSLEALINVPELKPQDVVSQAHNTFQKQKNSPVQFKLINSLRL